MISLIIILVAVYGIAVKYSAVQRADKEVTTACAVLKQRTIDVKNAMNDMPDPTAEQLDSTNNDIQHYNDQCASRTGVL